VAALGAPNTGSSAVHLLDVTAGQHCLPDAVPGTACAECAMLTLTLIT
jgi:hypothetical protein